MSAENPTPERFSIQSVIQGIIDTFDVNKGFIKTFRLLATQPGESIRSFLSGDRALLTKPFRLLLVTTAIAAFLTIQLSDQNKNLFEQSFNNGMELSQNKNKDTKSIEETSIENGAKEQLGQETKSAEGIVKKSEEKKEILEKIGEMYQNYFNLIILLSIPFMALGSFWLFKKSGFNYAEHIVLNSYILSFQNLIYLLTFPLITFVSFQFTWVYMLISYAYFAYVCVQFFETKPWSGAVKSIVAVFIGMLLYMIFITILMLVMVVVLIKK